MERCPACRARLREGASCYRCGCDLSLPLEAQAQAKAYTQDAVKALYRGAMQDAESAVQRALRLDVTPFSLALRDFIQRYPRIAIPSDPRLSALLETVTESAMEVHRALGKGLADAAYQACLCRELSLRRLALQRRYPVRVNYKDDCLDSGLRIDLVVADEVAVQFHHRGSKVGAETEFLNLLKLSGHRAGMLLDFNVEDMRWGIQRYVLKL